jgi:GDP-L-fucose synthase
MEHYDSEEIVNVGTGEDLAIRELAELIAEVVGYRGKITWDGTKPDGTPRKLMEVSRLRSLNWGHITSLSKRIADAYRWYTHQTGLKPTG